MSILLASDLSLRGGADRLWRRRSWPVGAGAREPYELAAGHGLPRGGFASPTGFWLAPEKEWASPPPYRLEFAPARRPAAAARNGGAMAGVAEGRRLRAAVSGRRRPGVLAGPAPCLALELAGRSARIAVDEAAWPEAREAGLLAVATAWRLEAIDEALDRLTDHARAMLGRRGWRSSDLGGGVGPSWRDLRGEAYALFLDLPEFEGPLTDPASFLPSSEAARLYRRLCVRLGLLSWRDRIDQRAEVLEGLIEALSARREHRQAIALQVGLEVLIIALLAADVAFAAMSWAWE